MFLFIRVPFQSFFTLVSFIGILFFITFKKSFWIEVFEFELQPQNC